MVDVYFPKCLPAVNHALKAGMEGQVIIEVVAHQSSDTVRGIEGWVRLEIEVTSTGTVSSAKVVDASPKDLFDRPALEAIQRWRFKPAYREVRAVAQRATLKMVFRLKQR